LIFYDLGYRIRLQPGDAIFFKSKQLLHGNAPLSNSSTDERFSLTFFTKRRDFHFEDEEETVEEREFGDEEIVDDGASH
jgi:ectoine hydroxylase-related dioxygenase (phytanoyl-CoA dioxygenase family)